MSRMRWRSALWSRASLLAYQLERCNSARRHERCTLTLKRSCIQAASSRRLAALRAFFDDLLKDLLVQRQIGHDAPKARVLIFKLPELAQLAHAQFAVLLLPRVVRGLRDANLAAHLHHRRAAVGHPQRIGDLLPAESGLSHRCSLPLSGPREATVPLVLTCRGFPGERQLQAACACSTRENTRFPSNHPSALPIICPIRTAPPGVQSGLNLSVPLGHSSTTVEPSRKRPISAPFANSTGLSA